jgi:hypothetical protein
MEILNIFILKDNSFLTNASLIISFTFIFIMYFILYKKRKYIFQKFDNMPSKRRINGKIFFWIYLITTPFSIYYIFGLV